MQHLGVLHMQLYVNLFVGDIHLFVQVHHYVLKAQQHHMVLQAGGKKFSNARCAGIHTMTTGIRR